MTQNNVIVPCGECGAKNRIPGNRLNDRPRCGKCHAPISVAPFPDHPIEVADRDFSREVLASSLPVLLDCWAPWCGPCKMIAPVLEQMAGEYAGRLKVAKLNVDENPATASRYGIQSIPTLLLFKGGEVVDTLVGALPREEIARRLALHI
ncbi:MAG: thioredoxin TrxC [Deltaproteobacteria bacterium]|nr:thioredoxin TrxC [Deltaproteobacteria bacterium]MBW1817386.1 thioredoxin TrxC [Deltaproteobacteria bacterium]MBW2284307.1 thioredoxin TrxC [Deltaproteobacteria bacterium]